ncbi:MAG: hypothetical protein ACRDGK_08120 [Actinomycetota bacterium]
MSDIPGWVVVIVIALVVVGLIAFARGREHRRGDEVGALSSHGAVVQIAMD